MNIWLKDLISSKALHTKWIIAFLFFLPFCVFAVKPEGLLPVVLDDQQKDVFVSRERMAFLEDTSCRITFEELLRDHLDRFRLSPDRKLTNTNTSSAYWLHFVIHNRSQKSHFRIELYDFDIDELTLFLPITEGQIEKENTGYSFPFSFRKVKHKNPGFDIGIATGGSQEVYLRVKSKQVNMLKPAVRHYSRFVEYGLKEYWLLGIFNGLMLLILVYNLIYFLLLRARHFLYYVLYGFCMLIYLNTRNGIGFQFLWPNYPELNPYLDGLALTGSIVFLLLFSNNYLELKTKNENLYRLSRIAIELKLLICLLQGFYPNSMLFIWVDFLFFQFAFCLWFIVFHPHYSKIKWHLTSFFVLNTCVFLNFCEYFGLIGSNVFTVYSLNIGVILQFVFLSIGLAESIRDNYVEKNRALTELLLIREKNESLRLTELKQQMNPHFLFNALNSIQSRILADRKEEAAKYLLSFSKLIRKNLENSDLDFIVLGEELQNTELYLSIERMRLGDSFHYHIHTPSFAGWDLVLIPTFLLQPLIENAIWHGLMPLHGEKRLDIDISGTESQLSISIKDNGIGIKNANKRKGKPGQHRSKGLKILAERLELIGKKRKKQILLEFFDLDEEAKTGTHARLTMEL